MNRERFDALARLLGMAGSRRSLFGGIVGAAVLGTSLDTDAKKRRRRRRRNNNGRKKAQAVCFGASTCEFKGTGGQDLAECNFSGSNLIENSNCGGCSFRAADLSNANLDGAKLGGASFRDANLNSATLVGANLQGASLRGACLTNADLTDAETDGGTLEGAFLCRTRLPDGQIANDNCATPDDCCKVCAPLGTACGTGVGDCCTGSTCFNGVCVTCVADADCAAGLICCNGLCVDPDSDPTNCGSCNAACIQPLICAEGQCTD